MFYPTNEIMASLLKREDVHLFCDMPKRPVLTSEVKERLLFCAERWNGYTHADYGDSYNEYFRNKNRCNFEDLYINRRVELADRVFAVIFLNKTEYLPRITYLIGLIAVEDTWCVPSHINSKAKDQKSPHILELYAAETAALLAITYRYLKDLLPEETKNIPELIRSRIFVPFLETDGYLWMGFLSPRVNNWNPWILSNVLLAAVCVCDDESEYRSLVKKAFVCEENYVRGLPEDGCVDEGVRYWHLAVACLFDSVELLYDMTGGRVDLTKAPILQKAVRYPMYFYDRSGLAANFADAAINFPVDTVLMYRIGQRTEQKELMAFAGALYRPDRLRELHDNFYRQLKNVYTASEIKPQPFPELPEMTLLPGIQTAFFRRKGLFTAVKGGHNGENHNHNDCGSFVCYFKEHPLFVDPGVDLYSGFTFGVHRFKLWYMRSDHHNLPRISGHDQQSGREFACTRMQASENSIRTDIAGAYGLDGSWVRTVTQREDTLTVEDSFSFDPKETVLYLMMAEKPSVSANVLTFACGATATPEGAVIERIETIDLTGKNPPDGIVGDAADRKTDGISFLIPTLLTKQWHRDVLYRLVCRPQSRRVTLTVQIPKE